MAPGNPAPLTVGQVVAELHGAARTADILPDDPLGPMLSATATMLRVLDAAITTLAGAVQSTRQTMTQALDQARATAQSSRDRFRAEAAAVEAGVIETIGRTVAHDAEQAIDRHRVVLKQNRMFQIAFGVTAIVLGSLGTGYWQGRSATLAAVQATQAGLHAAFAVNPTDAATWTSLMQWNHIADALSRCQRQGQSLREDGRIVCTVPLWIGPPTNPAPVDSVLPRPDGPAISPAIAAPAANPKRSSPRTPQGDPLRLIHPLKPARPPS